MSDKAKTLKDTKSLLRGLSFCGV
ncbi:MAG: hypothetical protein RL548_1373, partial [Bacteroidota bacterium]